MGHGKSTFIICTSESPKPLFQDPVVAFKGRRGPRTMGNKCKPKGGGQGCSEQAYFTRDRTVLVSLSSCFIKEITFSEQMLHTGLPCFPRILKLSPSPFWWEHIFLSGILEVWCPGRKSKSYPLCPSRSMQPWSPSLGNCGFPLPPQGASVSKDTYPPTHHQLPEGMPDADTSGLQLYLTVHICFLNDMQRQ